MSLLIAENLTQRYGAQTVFEGVSVQVSRGDRIALIGPNGGGKSTLLRILAGLQEPSAGSARRIGVVRVGYLPQEPELESDATLFDEMLKAFSSLRQQEEGLRKLEEQMVQGADEALLRRYDALLEDFRQAGGYEYESRIHRVLAGMGFSPGDEKQIISQLSGGERARASLARLLLEEPDVLLLDEPTNHLDLAALEWLEDYLSRWKGAFVLVSHDRYLMDKLAEKIWELEFGRLTEYPGNYTKYLELREAHRQRQWKLYEQQQEFIEKTEEFIRRNLAGGRFRERQAKAREKMLEKLERIEKPRVMKKLHLWIDHRQPSGERVLKARDLKVGYASRVLFECSSLNLNRGERVALIGPNGSGKTTFLKTILGQLRPLSGKIELGYNVEMAYFRQSQSSSEEADKTVLQVLLNEKAQTISEARSFLGQFLFSGDDVFKKLSELSGGERSRVELARLAQLGGNFLLLDEPTNHLDIPSREILQEALKAYSGTILLVSHDRYLIQALATQIWEIRDGRLHVYRGNYEYYHAKRAQEKAQVQALAETKAATRPKSPLKQQKQLEKQRQKLQANEAELMRAVAALEEELINIEKQMEEASYAGDHQRLRELTQAYREKQQALEQAYGEWTRMIEALAAWENRD